MTLRRLSAASRRSVVLSFASASVMLLHWSESSITKTVAATEGREGSRKSDDQKNATTFSSQSLDGRHHVFRPKIPYPAWDHNWDGRMTSSTTPQALSTAQGLRESKRRGTTRHIILIRHGQYDETSNDDEKRQLTPLGRRQAELTGQRLALLVRGGLGGMHDNLAGPCRVRAIHVSDMTRAKQTGKLAMNASVEKLGCTAFLTTHASFECSGYHRFAPAWH
jgi:Histidine phosphatase superfamily (branch 1)